MEAVCVRCGRKFNTIYITFKGTTGGGNNVCQRCRAHRGSTNNLAVLTEDLVRDIRRRHANGERYDVLARELRVHPKTVSDVTNGRTWAHVE